MSCWNGEIIFSNMRNRRYKTSVKLFKNFLLVIECTLLLLDQTLCRKLKLNSIIFDEHLQNATDNPYCQEMGRCKRGTHVMCMYGGEFASTMGPRCSDGKPLVLYNSERQLITDILNGLRRALTTGEEILGKDGVRLPLAFGIRKMFWDDELEKFAQVWANQCTVARDRCRSTERFHQAGQDHFLIRFNYPDWTIPSVNFVYDIPELTLEKRRYVIEKFFKSVYEQRKHVTPKMIAEYTGSGEDNSYLMAIYYNSRRVGCGMSTWLDYLHTVNGITITNAVFIVCDFSARPFEHVYDLQRQGADSECGCSKFLREADCLCLEFDDPIVSYEAPPWPIATIAMENETYIDTTPNEENPINIQLRGRCKGGQCSPPVVLMPIFTVEDGDPRTQQLRGNQARALMEQTRRKQEIRKEIKNRVEKVRDKYFKNYAVLEPKTGLSNRGPIDEDTFVLSKFVPAQKPNNNRKEIIFKQPMKKTLQTDIKSRRDLSDLDELISAYVRIKLNNLTTQLDEDQITDIIKSITKKFGDLQMIKNTGLRHGESDLYYEDKVYKGDLDDKNGKINGTLYSESEPKKVSYSRKNNVAHNMPRNQYSSTQLMQKGDLMDDVHTSEIATTDTSHIDYSIGHLQNLIKAQRNYLPKRSQNPLHTYAGVGNFNYRLGNDAENQNLEYNKPQFLVLNLDPEYYKQFYNDDAGLDKASYGYSRRQNRHKVYDVNKIRHYYYDRFNHGRSSRYHDERLRQNRRLQGDSEESHQEQRYYVPDRRHL